MIPKILQGLYLIQNLDTNYLLQKNKQKEKLKLKKNNNNKEREEKISHSHNTKRTEYRTELMYRAMGWIRIAAARV